MTQSAESVLRVFSQDLTVSNNWSSALGNQRKRLDELVDKLGGDLLSTELNGSEVATFEGQLRVFANQEELRVTVEDIRNTLEMISKQDMAA